MENGTTTLTVQRRVHAANIDKQADHGHDDGRRHILGELLLQYLAALAALAHGIDIDFSKGEAFLGVRIPSKTLLFVVEYKAQELVLDVFPPQRDAILLLQMADLISRVDG